ncbi:hypothetical protein DL766_005884 [Monosporascus sp. MC13-8B]|uniref:Uncharacterized protein n=1 Tax=Monosporascus cannonballus TaxID=155416 RepID=A0ABY0GV28_9PEZI|nr:hypothetical protein DL762_010595 [Monosporascus cannonballus]RYP28386.1 hypothetical protein DL766_005884 [Monosporascus sp. MC13-8B]
MPSLIEKLQAKLELFRLEQRYTRNRRRRSTFISNAIYKDGEYIYQTPNTTGSSTSSTPWSPIEEERPRSFDETCPQEPPKIQPPSTAERKKMRRWSTMPSFGSLERNSGRDWRPSVVDVREVR